MLFNSIEFAVFLPIVFFLYWFVFDKALSHCKYQLRLQNAFIIVVSYIFYGWWNWRFLLLIAFTSFCSYGSGLLISKSQQVKSKYHLSQRFWMWINIVLNLGILATFKYYDFFVTEFAQLFGLSSDVLLVQVILPVGISFYTFQALSYSIDVYRKKIEPSKDIVAFFAFISFFPQLVAGPIERATNLLPQFNKRRSFNLASAEDGMRQILWGLFKKIVVADNCAVYVDQIFSTYNEHNGSSLLVAAILFTFQIYGDFSGYSDIAIGTAKLFGINLMRNFSYPYFSRDIAEFWRRWHISLTTWFRDYVYIPLGGSRVSKGKIIRNTFVIFLLSGFWHGANWTFLLWGAYHALLFLPLILSGKNRKNVNQVAVSRFLPTLKETRQMFLTFSLAVIGWILFRSPDINTAAHYLLKMLNTSIFSLPSGGNAGLVCFFQTLLSVFIMVIVEWIQRDKQHGLDISNKPILFRYAIYIATIEFIIFFMPSTPSQFIYFQF